MSIKKIVEQGKENKFLGLALIGWAGISVASGILITLMIVGPDQSFSYFMWGIFDISIVVFVGLGILFVPLVAIDMLRITRYKKKILRFSKGRYI